jgi:hypothetical protein
MIAVTDVTINNPGLDCHLVLKVISYLNDNVYRA